MAKSSVRIMSAIVAFTVLATVKGYSDDQLNRLITSENYKEAIDYADDKIPPGDRDADVWMKLAKANDALGMTEKALACYLVSWRMNPNDYQSLVGAARIYNKLGQPDNAINMAKKALDINFSADASWEYAKACIGLNRPADAKKALEKVIEADSSNAIANRELGNIYFSEKSYAKAIALLKKSFKEKADGETSFKIGKCYVETGVSDSAIIYLKDAVMRKSSVNQATLALARAYYGQGNYTASVNEYQKASKGDMAAEDFYALAVSSEKTNNVTGAVNAYQDAVGAYGNSKTKDALSAREKVGRAALASKNYTAALLQFQFISDVDDRGAIVPDVYFLLADAYQGSDNGPKAISSLEKAISLNSKNIEAYARLADLYSKNGMADKAKSTYEAMMSLSPNDPNVYLILGQYNLKAKKYSEAMEQLDKSDALKHSATACEGIAIAAFNLDKVDKARDAARAAISLDGSVWDARLILAKILMRDKNYRDAQEQLEVIVKKEAYKVDYLEQLATCYEQNDQKDKLAEIDRKIVSLSRTSVDSRVRLARFSDTKNDITTSIAMYKELSVLSPKNIEVFRRLYELSSKKGEKADAVFYMKKYLDLSPNDAEGQRDLGDMLYDQKDLDGALSAYRAALKINPAVKGFYKRYAEIVIAKGQTDEVVTALSGVIKTGEADFGTYTTLGMIYQKKKMYPKSIEMYQKALQIDPQNMDALTAMGSCQAAAGDVDEAIISYEQAVMMSNNATSEYKELGDLYARQHKLDESMKAYKKYLDKVPSDLSVATQVGKFSFEKNQFAEAVKYLSLVKGKDVDVDQIYGEACFRSGNAKEAIAILESVKQRKPKVGLRSTVRMLAEAYEKDGKQDLAGKNYGEYLAIPGVRDGDAAYKYGFMQEKSAPVAASKVYEENTKNYPGDYRNFLRLGLMLSDKTETLQKSMAMLKRTTELADSVPTVWLELAKVYGKSGKQAEELDAYRKYVQTDPQNLEANKRLGSILVSKGQISEGLVFLEMANTLSPNDAETMTLLAKGYVKTGRTNEAIDLLVKAKAVRKEDPDIRFQLYDLYQKSGQQKKAQEEIKSLVELKRDNKYLIYFAQALLAQNKFKDALNAVEDILATTADDLDALMLKARIQRADKKYDEAVETYKEISYINPEHAPSLNERAETYMQMSKPQWAETFYKRALKADPKFALAELGLAKIAKNRKDDAQCREHLDNARRLDPNNEQILDEIQKLK